MSDDSDRMERAERIRRMREGTRSNTNGQEESDDGTASESGATALAEAEPDDADANGSGADGDVDAEATDTEPTPGPTDGASETPDEATETGGERAEPTEQTTEQAAAGSDDRADPTPEATEPDTTDPEPGPTERDDGADDTTEAADPAAASAFEFAGNSDTDDGGTMSGQTVDTDQQHSTRSSTTQDVAASTAVDTEQDDTTAPTDGGADAEGADGAADVTDAPAGVDAETETKREPRTRVLEFTLGEEQYCLDIDYIEEIVKRETITRVPNTPEYVEGVVDLRGQITTILNPKPVMEIDADGAEELIVVFDADEFDEGGAIGWLVDDVRQVTPVSDDEVNQPPIDEEYINGVIDREEDDQFVIWTTPDLALDEASS
jgi:purine-binding chemotaxis protein CheW